MLLAFQRSISIQNLKTHMTSSCGHNADIIDIQKLEKVPWWTGF
jgi:hypothetical protein